MFPVGYTTFAGSDKSHCFIDHSRGWSNKGCWRLNDTSTSVHKLQELSIDNCSELAKSSSHQLFAMLGNNCTLLSHAPSSLLRLHNSHCSFLCDSESFASCGGPNKSFSLYSVLPSNYIGTFEHSICNTNLSRDFDRLDHFSTAYPSLESCFNISISFGYRHFTIGNGTTCFGTNAQMPLNCTQRITSSSALCLNGDPCGGNNTYIVYSVDEALYTTAPSAPANQAGPPDRPQLCQEKCQRDLIVVFTLLSLIFLIMSIFYYFSWKYWRNLDRLRMEGQATPSVSVQGDPDYIEDEEVVVEGI